MTQCGQPFTTITSPDAAGRPGPGGRPAAVPPGRAVVGGPPLGRKSPRADQRQSLPRRRAEAQGGRRREGLGRAAQCPAGPRGHQDPLPGCAPDRRREAGRSDHRAACRGADTGRRGGSSGSRRSTSWWRGSWAGRRRGSSGPRGKAGRPPRVRLVHRLDRDTSGVMVLALSAEAERLLVQMFRKHDIHRVYLAIAQGRVEAQTLESSLVRDRGDRRRGSTKLPRSASGPSRTSARWSTSTATRCRVPPGDRPHASDPHSPGRGRPSALRREGLQQAAVRQADRRPQRRPASGPARRRTGLQASHHRRGAALQDAAAGRHGEAAGETAGRHGGETIPSPRVQGGKARPRGHNRTRLAGVSCAIRIVPISDQ